MIITATTSADRAREALLTRSRDGMWDGAITEENEPHTSIGSSVSRLHGDLLLHDAILTKSSLSLAQAEDWNGHWTGVSVDGVVHESVILPVLVLRRVVDVMFVLLRVLVPHSDATPRQRRRVVGMAYALGRISHLSWPEGH
jgi:hypothetical protein